MRAPGEASGSFALESALDELACALKMDPLALRLVNHADAHPLTGKPWSAKRLRECYRLGAERFGWADRSPVPRSMRAAAGRLVGWGMAIAAYPAHQNAASARVRRLADGSAQVASATHDLGTAVANAVYHATGRRVRDLPITIDKLLDA